MSQSSLVRPALLASSLLATLVVSVGAVPPQAPRTGKPGMKSEPPPECPQGNLACASFAAPAFDPQGRLWLVWAAGGRVSVARSSDRGRTFSTPVVVSAPIPAGGRLDTGADARPQIVIDGRGRIVVGYSVIKNDQLQGQVLVTHSTDGGASFSPARPITDDPASQRFIIFALESDGRILATWIDKRNTFAAKAAGKEIAGASLAVAWSRDGGATFSAAKIVIDGICECCRLGVTPAGQGRTAVALRNIFGKERDHAVLTFDGVTPGPVHRVAIDKWAIDGCPHHGPSLAVAQDGSYHAVWFTGGEARQGAFYARSRDGGRTFSEPMSLGGENHAMRPFVAALGSRVWLAWKEHGQSGGVIVARSSDDAGATWSPRRVVASAAAASDHPLLITDGRGMYLSWLAREEGYRLLPLDAGSPGTSTRHRDR